MTPDRYARVCELFDEAERLAPADRRRFLADRCGPDTDLLAEVEGMLAHAPSRDTTSLLDTPCPVNIKAVLPPKTPAPLAGQRVGPYEIRRQIGSGGMGTVFLAARVDDYEQLVALKVLRSGLPTDELVERFRTERQLLAGLSHPNIGRLLDGGTTHDGLPFFVMEYIDGEPLDRHCESRSLGTRDRARLLLSVCDAVEYAHRRTVVHRDLKPGNVLVTADGTAKVVDFGLAKRTDAGDGRTHTGVILGTPSYMAPEQAAGKGRDVGPAADVYALGAILYELLTGRPPFRAETPLDTVWQALNEEPVPPSRLMPNLPRDLETICLKCLQKDPARRYGSAAELRDDLRRFLEGEPIQARPVGRVERAWRWCRRNPRVALLTAALLLTFATGFIAVTALWLVAEQRGEDLAAKTKEAEKQRDRAEKNFDRVFTAVQESFTTISKSKELRREEMQPFRQKLLEGALRQYEDFLKELGDNPRAAEQVARAHLRLGHLLHYMGRTPQALARLRRGLEMTEQLLKQQPASFGYRNLQALGHEYLGVASPDLKESVRAFERCWELREAMQRDFPERAAGIRSQLAFDYYNAATRMHGRAEEALGWVAKARAIREKQVAAGNPSADGLEHLAQICLLMGAIERDTGRKAEAEASCRRGIAVYERLARQDADAARWQVRRAEAYLELNLALSNAGKRPEALAALDAAVGILERWLARDVPPGASVLPVQLALARAYFNRSIAYQHQLKFDEAQGSYEQTLALCDKLLAVRPTDVDLHEWRGTACFNLGQMARVFQPAAAADYYRQACASKETIARIQPNNAQNLSELGGARHALSEMLGRVGRRADALAEIERAVTAQRKASALDRSPQMAKNLAARLKELGRQLRLLKCPAEAAAVSRERAELLRGDRHGQYETAAELSRCIPLAEHPSEREQYAAAAVERLRAAVAAGYRDADYLRDDDDFAPLRDRPDFVEVLRSLQK